MSLETRCRCMSTIGSSAASGAGILHDSLVGVNDAGTGVAKGHITASTQSIVGAKTFTDDLSLDGDLILTSGGDIISQSNNDIRLIPNGTGITKIGTGTTSRSLDSPDDLFITGDLEVDGTLFCESNILLTDNRNLQFGNSNDAFFTWRTSQTPDAFMLLLTSNSRNFIIATTGGQNYDFQHSLQSNPTLWIQSNNNSLTEWISIAHDQTDGVIDCGTGTLNLGGTANVNFAGATRTASTVTHDAYVTLEIAGTPYNFMLGT